ncbi:MAG TPA: OsmC family protein [Longimicrobiales bacterium]|nr:OsmC family protein [Longimicrobiales bacterium]
MDRAGLRAVQAPLKERYRADPSSAVVTLRAEGRVGEGITCSVETGRALVEAGLHPASGGSGASACSGDMLLQALAACAGVTLAAVATAKGIELDESLVRVEGDLDFRGTLGVDRDAPVGFRAIRVSFDLDSDADDARLDELIEITERYCVVLQTLRGDPALEVSRGPA